MINHTKEDVGWRRECWLTEQVKQMPAREDCLSESWRMSRSWITKAQEQAYLRRRKASMRDWLWLPQRVYAENQWEMRPWEQGKRKLWKACVCSLLKCIPWSQLQGRNKTQNETKQTGQKKPPSPSNAIIQQLLLVARYCFDLSYSTRHLLRLW